MNERTTEVVNSRPAAALASAYDKDGWLQIPIGSRTGWIRPNENPWYVRRIIYSDQSVFLGIDFPAVPFRAEHLTQAVTLLAQFADKAMEDLGGAEKPEEVTEKAAKRITKYLRSLRKPRRAAGQEAARLAGNGRGSGRGDPALPAAVRVPRLHLRPGGRAAGSVGPCGHGNRRGRLRGRALRQRLGGSVRGGVVPGPGEEYFEKPDRLDTADLDTLRRLLTLHVRKDRFADGHLLSMFQTGHMQAILRRLRSLHES